MFSTLFLGSPLTLLGDLILFMALLSSVLGLDGRLMGQLCSSSVFIHAQLLLHRVAVHLGKVVKYLVVRELGIY